MKKKRVLSALVAAAAAFCFVLPPGRAAVLPQPVTASAEDAADGLTVSRSKVRYGETFNLSVNIPASSNLVDTIEIRIDFDPQAFEVTSWNPQIPYLSIMSNRNNTDGYIVMASSNAEANIDLSNGLAFSATVRARNGAKTGSYSFDLTVADVSNYDTKFSWQPKNNSVSVKLVNRLVSVSGKITACLPESGSKNATVTLTDTSGSRLSLSTQLNYNSISNMYEGSYDFSEAESDEKYTLVITVPGCRTRTEEIQVNLIPVTLDPKLNIIGDVDGDGRVGASDATQILRYLVGANSIIKQKYSAADSYLISVAHVNNSGELSVTDATQILRYVAGYSSVIDSI